MMAPVTQCLMTPIATGAASPTRVREHSLMGVGVGGGAGGKGLEP